MNKQKKISSFKDFLKELREKAVNLPKPVDEIEEIQYFLIVCEGERTEPAYFNYYKKFLHKNQLDTFEVTGEGDNTINIVKKAIVLNEERKKNILMPDFDEVWAIYDKDDFPPVNYHEAISLAEKNGIESGHSNQSFELWYVLHFQFLQSALHRSDYIKILSRELGFKYTKNDTKVVQFLFDNCDVQQAIQWAEKLEKMHAGTNPAYACPYTRVYKLVYKLHKYFKTGELDE